MVIGGWVCSKWWWVGVFNVVIGEWVCLRGDWWVGVFKVVVGGWVGVFNVVIGECMSTFFNRCSPES